MAGRHRGEGRFWTFVLCDVLALHSPRAVRQSGTSVLGFRCRTCGRPC